MARHDPPSSVRFRCPPMLACRPDRADVTGRSSPENMRAASEKIPHIVLSSPPDREAEWRPGAPIKAVGLLWLSAIERLPDCAWEFEVGRNRLRQPPPRTWSDALCRSSHEHQRWRQPLR